MVRLFCAGCGRGARVVEKGCVSGGGLVGERDGTGDGNEFSGFLM